MLGGTAHAGIILTAILTNAQENPPVGTVVSPLLTGPGGPDPSASRPVSFGTATFELNDAMTALTFTSTVFNIDFTGNQTPGTFDNFVAGHIHAGAAVTPATNGPVVWGFFGTPFNDTMPTNTVIVPFLTGVGGTVTGTWDLPEGNSTATNPNVNLTTQLSFILTGRSYINFHTAQFPGGEVRGQLVPEPSTTLLLAFGALGLLGFSARSRRSVKVARYIRNRLA